MLLYESLKMLKQKMKDIEEGQKFLIKDIAKSYRLEESLIKQFYDMFNELEEERKKPDSRHKTRGSFIWTSVEDELIRLYLSKMDGTKKRSELYEELAELITRTSKAVALRASNLKLYLKSEQKKTGRPAMKALSETSPDVKEVKQEIKREEAPLAAVTHEEKGEQELFDPSVLFKELNKLLHVANESTQGNGRNQELESENKELKAENARLKEQLENIKKALHSFA